jgi:hypothetical protein
MVSNQTRNVEMYYKMSLDNPDSTIFQSKLITSMEQLDARQTEYDAHMAKRCQLDASLTNSKKLVQGLLGLAKQTNTPEVPTSIEDENVTMATTTSSKRSSVSNLTAISSPGGSDDEDEVLLIT